VISFALNALIAVIWLLLRSEPSPEAFAVGWAIGFALLSTFQPILGSHDYVRRGVAFVRFLLEFVGEVLVANVRVAWAVLVRSKQSMHPNFMTYDVSGLRQGEILLLSYCISLTPGVTTVDVSRDFRTLIIHALDAEHPAAIRAEIDRTLKRGILAFTR